VRTPGRTTTSSGACIPRPAATLLVVHAKPLGHGLHGFALPVQHQTPHVKLTFRALVRTRQLREHLRREGFQTRPDLAHLPGCHTVINDPNALRLKKPHPT
jgi:hypothetical protein